MKLILIRHGQSQYNVLRKINHSPHIKVSLTLQGEQEAKQAKQELENETWECMFVSELYRTQQTGAMINEGRSSPIIIDARINEYVNGYEGGSYDEYSSKTYLPEYAPHQGESYLEFQERLRSFLKELFEKEYETVNIITHFSVIKAIYLLLFPQSEPPQPKTGEIFHIELDKDSQPF